MTDVRVPTLGESVTEATVATWFKKPGDSVIADEMLCELETDKVTVEVPCPATGTLAEIVAAEGTSVGIDALLAHINAEDGTQAAPAPSATAPARVPLNAARDVEDAPSAKKMMTENNLAAGSVDGTGKDGRVMKEDVQRALAAAPAPSATVPAPRAPVAAR